MVVFPLLTYFTSGWMMGWASAPYDPYWSQRHPRRAAWMSLAGPCANFTLMIIGGILIHIGIWTGMFTHPASVTFMHLVDPAAPGLATGAGMFVSLLFSLNLLLGVFNLFPLPPLDGFGVTGLFVSEDTARRIQAAGQSMRAYSIVGMIVAWRLFDYIFDPVFLYSVKALYPGQGYGA
jgi:Zn-dependent protease